MTVTERPTSAVSTEDRAALGTAVADLLRDRCTDADVRRVMATGDGYDPALWAVLAGELGLAGLAVPAEYGGSAGSWQELAVVLEELGRALYPGPLLATVLAAEALVAGTDEAARAEHLPALAAGELVATVAIPAPAAGSLPAASVTASPEGVLDGAVSHVLDGHLARVLVVVAAAPEGPGVYVTGRDAAGLTASVLPTMDPTRRIARVELSGVRATRIGGADLVGHLTDAGAVAVACGAVGGAQAAMDAATGYAQVRTQFDRPIGSFQAVKHTCADMFLAVESGRAAARRAARELAECGGETAVLASVAKAWCSEAYVATAAGNLQIHGGVGFTWEHSAHLHLKRAKTDELLYGDARHHRARLADLLGI